MAFFQNSVINKHLKALDKEVVKAAYAKFRNYFHNPEIQQNIRELNEEQFQQKFLIELFVNIFGYTINPDPDYNLTTEYKNEKGAKKADGAILSPSGGGEGGGKEAIGVIELKSTKTKDLDKINTQAFNYKNNQTGCIYVITSNFEKLRFFIHNSVNHVEFNLFTLTEQEFELLWLCMSADNLLGGVPLKAKEESLLAEENITRQLYKDYSSFKNDLWQSMVKNSPEADRLLLFKKTQKLLDRFLFIFFGEDSGLLPPNSISRIVQRWNILQEEDAYKPLYDIFKQYFEYINTGRKGKTSQDDIFAYNGGLFFHDEVLDNIVIDDGVLHPHVMKLTAYDFQSEVDVNILGHIFENSLNEIENVIAKLEGQEVDKSKTKRKKEGVFYTPNYITKYIVDNTVGKLCEEKKAELSIVDEEYAKGRRNRKKETVKKLDESIQAYRDWLLNITICDPACGSGAFLNQALEFLIEEHEYIDELQAQLLGATIVFQDVSNHILEKNIYGVDINEESVDIAKLSLWLRTAQRGRKLTSLNNNLKCGNSLIDDPEVAGEKAFNWKKEFLDIFPEKDKKAWHVTWVTHDTRTSQRMIKYKVRERRANGQMHIDRPMYLEGKDAIKVTEIICDIVVEDKINCLAYNVCDDHTHIILVCEKEELSNIIRKLKGKSSQKFKEYLGIPKDETFHLWAQKSDKTPITSDKQLFATINYINQNREKHKLPDINKGLQPLVNKMVCSYEHAFRPEYKGGFDVVIGNPPYVVLSSFANNEFEYLQERYKTAYGRLNLFALFIERCTELISSKGQVGLIIPDSLCLIDYYRNLRKFLLDNHTINGLLEIGDGIFDDATVPALIVLFEGTIRRKNKIMTSTNRDVLLGGGKPKFVEQDFYYKTPKNSFNLYADDIFVKLNDMIDGKRVFSLKDVLKIKIGICTGSNKKHLNEEPIYSNSKKVLQGRDINRFKLVWGGMYVNYSKQELLRSRDELIFLKKEKLLLRQTSDKLILTYDDEQFYTIDSLFIIYPKEEELNLKYCLAILNSKLLNRQYQKLNPETGRVFAQVKIDYVNELPIIKPNNAEQEGFAELANKILVYSKDLGVIETKFVKYLAVQTGIDINNKLHAWHELEFGGFIKELNKAIKKSSGEKLSKMDEMEWMEVFDTKKAEAQNLKAEIDKTDKEIDQMVYELYGLTEEEIKIVEESI